MLKVNITVKLSQHYDILADITKEIAKLYKSLKDRELMELYHAYINMRKGIRSLSKSVREQLIEYEFQILKGDAILMDYFINGGNGGGGGGGETGCFGGDPEWDCFWCEVAAGAISINLFFLFIFFIKSNTKKTY